MIKKDKLKIRICTFDIAKYGGIISNVESRIKAFRDMGHDCDIILLTYNNSISETSYKNKIKKLEEGILQKKLEENIKSQSNGYSKSEILGYWRNNYHGWYLPPENRVAVYGKNSVQEFYDKVKDCDIVFWIFSPTKTIEAKGFNYWTKFFDLPKNIKQVMGVHDGYYDVRNSWIMYLKDKIKYFDCTHVSAYNSVKNFSIPRYLNYISRTIPKKQKFKNFDEKPIDFFSAHIFKSMKKMENLILIKPYLKKKYNLILAGGGIELYFLMKEDVNCPKYKKQYKISKKNDPNCLDNEIGQSIWNRSINNGMEFWGLLSNEDVYTCLSNSKFAIDPSFSKKYAEYSHTHLNGFTIEAIINGSYPVLICTKGLAKKKNEIEDYIYNNLKAIYIPWNSTPKQFANILNEAMKMDNEKYNKDIQHNFNLAKELFDPNKNMKKVIDLSFSSRKKLKKILDIGIETDLIKSEAEKTMREFFKYDKLPIEWKN